MLRPFFTLLLSFFLTTANVSLPAHADASAPVPQASLQPSPVVSVVPEKISRKEIRRIRRTFNDLLETERNALRAEQRRQRREKNAERKLRRQSITRTEREARRKFFEATHLGAEKREYMHAFNERRKAFDEQLSGEERQERKEQDARWKKFQSEQRRRLLLVEESLRRSERPDPALLKRED
jgi:hypothetical protein